jgi:hypothetical protein
MQNDIQKQIRGAILLVLRPLARSLLRVGVGYREFAEIAKAALVETATQDDGLRGRPTNVSRVAVMTGLTRKEVKRIRDGSLESDSQVSLKTTPVSQILHRWHTDSEFLDQNGEPRALRFKGDEVDFSYLVKKYGGDVPAGAMRTELRRIDAIEEVSSDTFRPTKRVVYNEDVHDKFVGGMAGIIYPAAINLSHNIGSSEDEAWWPNLNATSKYIREADRGRIMRISKDRISEFVESMDDTFGAYEALNDRNRSGEESIAVGIGVYYFEEDKSESDVFF